jgi:hypothetical protein
MTLDEEDDIVYTLENVSLIEPRPYFALSYCWGDPRVTERIRLGEGTVIVTASLVRGLRVVRKLLHSMDRSVKSVKLWVDAVCINQNDARERSQ